MLMRLRSAVLPPVGGGPWPRGDAARLVARLEVQAPDGRRATGILAGIPWLGEDLLTDQEAGVEAVAEAVRLCASAGAQVVGLGAVAAVIGGQGKAVARAVEVPVTTGNTLTALAAVRTCESARQRLGRRGPVALLGLPGPVATGILRRLATEGHEILVVDPRPSRPVQKLIEGLNARGPGRITCVSDVAEPLTAGHILIAASSTGGRITLSSVPSRSVIIDVAAPQDVLHDVSEREDVLVLDGEYVRLPRPVDHRQLLQRLYSRFSGQGRHIYACYAEPMVLAFSGAAEPLSLGRQVPLEAMSALERLAVEQGFWVDGLFEGGRRLRAARLDRFSAR